MPALVVSLGIHGVLVAVVLHGISRSDGSQSSAARPEGIIGSAAYDQGSGVASALAPPESGPLLDPTEAARYVGRYVRAQPGGSERMVEVGLVNDGDVEPHWALIVLDGEGPVQKLVPVAADTFALQLAPRQRVLFRRAGDSVEAVSVRRGGDTSWASRATRDTFP